VTRRRSSKTRARCGFWTCTRCPPHQPACCCCGCALSEVHTRMRLDRLRHETLTTGALLSQRLDQLADLVATDEHPSAPRPDGLEIITGEWLSLITCPVTSGWCVTLVPCAYPRLRPAQPSSGRGSAQRRRAGSAEQTGAHDGQHRACQVGLAAVAALYRRISVSPGRNGTQGLPTLPVEGRSGSINPGALRVPQQAFLDWAQRQARGKSGSAFVHTMSLRYSLVFGAASTAAVATYVVPKIMEHA